METDAHKAWQYAGGCLKDISDIHEQPATWSEWCLPHKSPENKVRQ